MSKPAMQDQEFWRLIDRARGDNTASAIPGRLHTVIDQLETEQVKAFMRLFIEKLCELNDWKLWAAGYAIAGGMSDDSFHYFRSWIIGKGRQVYDLALQSPDDLGPYIDDPEVDNEPLEYVPLNILRNRGDKNDPRDDVGCSADAMPKGEKFDEGELDTLMPKLCAQFA